MLSSLLLAPLTLLAIWLGGVFFLGMVLAAIFICLYEWIGLSTIQGKTRYGALALGAVYLSICFASFVFLRAGFEQGVWLTMAVFVCVAASDTGAYAFGKLIGGPKMAPKISPNKTWAGFAGAVAAFAVFLTGFVLLLPIVNVPLWAVFLAGGFLGAVGQVGDLFISSFKRRAGLKDTGNLIPGHGGLLDRIDGLLLVSPVFLFLWELWLR